MRHLRPSWWRRACDAHPRLPDVLSIIGIIVALGVGLALLLWIAAARITGVG